MVSLLVKEWSTAVLLLLLTVLNAVVDPADRYTISGTGYGLEGKVHHAAGSAATIEDADLIAKPTMIGYMNGLALTILVGQPLKLFGFKVEANGLLGELTGFVKGLGNGEAVPAAAMVAITGISTPWLSTC